MSIINGEVIDRKITAEDIIEITEKVEKDLAQYSLNIELVVSSLDKLSLLIEKEKSPELVDSLCEMGIAEKSARSMVFSLIVALKKETSYIKLKRAFNTTTPFCPEKVPGMDDIRESFLPVGILSHVVASNHPINAVETAVDGLLTGNINILKMPSQKNCFAERFFNLLLKNNTYLVPFLYSLNIPSTEKELLKSIFQVSDCIAVYGSDSAIKGVKSLTSQNKRIISWGHKISFAYVSNSKIKDKTTADNLAHDICVYDQLLCSSPQCIFVEAKNQEQLIGFATLFAKSMEKVSPKYPANAPNIHEQSEITTQVCLAKTGEVLGENYVIEDPENYWRIIVDKTKILKPSPLFRTVIIKPIIKKNILASIRPLKEYLQTVALACTEDEKDGLSKLLLKSGVTRICSCGYAQNGYFGEPHDGTYTLREYVKRIRV